MKLEFKNIAPYLPYRLKWTSPFGRPEAMTGLMKDNVIIDSEGTEINDSIDLNYLETPRSKPILKHLNDLTEDVLCIHWVEYIKDKGLDSELPYEVWTTLFENHYDVFELIDKGLAEDYINL